MARKSAHPTPHPDDPEGHVKAVEADLEYYRIKRLEPRIIYLARRGVVTFYDLLNAHASLTRRTGARRMRKRREPLEARIRALEDGLDEYVEGIALVSSDAVQGVDVVIEDGRKERGDYDEFFRIHKKEHAGSLTARVAGLETDLRDYRALLEAFTHALIQKGLLDAKALERGRAALSRRGVWNGARLTARAWVDPEFKARLIARGREAVRELHIPPGRVGKLAVVENTETVHNVIVCTLCSCYPYDLLGDTPWWYKQDIYKKRIVENPRKTLEEMFGLEIPRSAEVRVHDSTSDVRYMVIPRRPSGTEGMAEEELARLVTEASLIGAGECHSPLKAPERDEKRRRSPRPRPV